MAARGPFWISGLAIAAVVSVLSAPANAWQARPAQRSGGVVLPLEASHSTCGLQSILSAARNAALLRAARSSQINIYPDTTYSSPLLFNAYQSALSPYGVAPGSGASLPYPSASTLNFIDRRVSSQSASTFALPAVSPASGPTAVSQRIPLAQPAPPTTWTGTLGFRNVPRGPAPIGVPGAAASASPFGVLVEPVSPTTTPAPADVAPVGDTLKRAESALLAGSYMEARHLYVRALVDGGNETMVRVGLALSEFALGEFEDAGRTVAAAIRRAPGLVGSAFNVRTALGGARDYTTRLAALERFATANPDNAPAWLVLGFVRFQSGFTELGREAFRRYCTIPGCDAQVAAILRPHLGRAGS